MSKEEKLEKHNSLEQTIIEKTVKSDKPLKVLGSEKGTAKTEEDKKDHREPKEGPTASVPESNETPSPETENSAAKTVTIAEDDVDATIAGVTGEVDEELEKAEAELEAANKAAQQEQSSNKQETPISINADPEHEPSNSESPNDTIEEI